MAVAGLQPYVRRSWSCRHWLKDFGPVQNACRRVSLKSDAQQTARPTSRGGHLAVYEAIRAQLDPPMGQVLRPFDRIRRQRHDMEYPPTDAPQITAEDVRDDAAKAAAMVDAGPARRRRRGHPLDNLGRARPRLSKRADPHTRRPQIRHPRSAAPWVVPGYAYLPPNR